jgi:hypothetical protein
MAMNPLPPQAYTKDSILKAYSWLQNQDPSIKEMATTTDILVSLYLKATRDGDAVLERPSIQNFKHELKQLAGMMGEFDKDIIDDKILKEKNKSQQQVTQQTTGYGLDKALDNLSTKSQQSFPQEKSIEAELNAHTDSIAEFLTKSSDSKKAILAQANHAHEGVKRNDASLISGLDAKSLMMISDVRSQLNLSSDMEALKLLIQTGYNKTKKLF